MNQIQIAALFFLSNWALEQNCPPLPVIGAADCVYHIAKQAQTEMAGDDNRDKIVRILLEHLPDTGFFDDPSWDWAWEELSSDAQENVKNARAKAVAFLMENE